MSEFRFTKNAALEVIKIQELTDQIIGSGATAKRKVITTNIVPQSGDVTPAGDDLIQKDPKVSQELLTDLG